jgi:hypothetical protein
MTRPRIDMRKRVDLSLTYPATGAAINQKWA